MSAKSSFIIEGLAGERKLKGTVHINGAKNAAIKVMSAAVLFDAPVTLENVPDTADVETLSNILRKLGATAEWVGDSAGKRSTLRIDSLPISSTDIDCDLAQSMRASVTLTGPMLARFGKVSFPTPGGCVIGARPVDLFLEGYRKMGASVGEDQTLYRIEAPHGLHDAEIFFNKQTVGATETLMFAAVLGHGRVILKNCAMEPEIESFAVWLNTCGANITGAGTPTITVKGTKGKLLKPRHPYVTIPDRIEAGSFLILGALCAEDLSIENCEPKHMEAVVNILKDCGVPIEVAHSKSVYERGSVKIVGNVAPTSLLNAVADLRTHEYPGFPTDIQAPMVTFLTQANGQSLVFETIYEDRFKYVEDLQEMGAAITVMTPREILIKGPTPLRQLPDGEEIRAHDIRAGFAIVLAALVGKGRFTVTNVQLIDRGYEKLEERLRALGAKVERV